MDNHSEELNESGTFQGFVEADDNLPVTEDLCDENIIRMVQEDEKSEDSATDVSGNESDCAAPMTSGEVMIVLGRVCHHIQFWTSDREGSLGLVTKLEEAVLKNSVNAAMKQTKLENYFTSNKV